MSLCSDCMPGGAGGRGNSPYSYEVFRRMPFFGSISNYLRFFKGGSGGGFGGIGGMGGSGMLNQITSLIGGGGSSGGFPGGQMPFPSPGGRGFPSGPGGFPGGQGGPAVNPNDVFKMLNIRNLLPVG